MNFERSWEDYKNGFGYLRYDFWLGNEILSYITNQAVYELRIDMELSNGSAFHVTYDSFRISDEKDDYKMLRVEDFRASGGEIDVFQFILLLIYFISLMVIGTLFLKPATAS